MVILNEEGDEDACNYPWSDSEDSEYDDVPEEPPSNPEPLAPDDAPSNARLPVEVKEDDESFVPEDLSNYSTAPHLPIYPGLHAVFSMSDHMDGLHAKDQERRQHEEELANWPSVYDTYLSTFARWYHNHPEPNRNDELNVTRDDDDNHLFREFLTDVVKLLPVPEAEQEAWAVATIFRQTISNSLYYYS
jgi:hypothetical protein